jgi:uncharacterized protein YndB with AHSA1/START domain
MTTTRMAATVGGAAARILDPTTPSNFVVALRDREVQSCSCTNRTAFAHRRRSSTVIEKTENPRSVVDEEAFSVRRTIHISAPVDAVWRAVTEPEHVSRWFGDLALDAHDVGTVTFTGYGAIPIRVEAVDAPRSVTYRWTNDDAAGVAASLDEARSTVFTFTLEPLSDGTGLTVVETGFETTSAPLANLADHAGGWDSELDELVALLESAA